MVMFRSFIEIGWAALTNYWLRLSMFKHWTKHRTRDPFNLRWKSSTATAMKLSCKYSITNLILAGLVCLITRLWQKPDALDWNYAWLNMKFDGRLHSKWCQHLIRLGFYKTRTRRDLVENLNSYSNLLRNILKK